MTPNGRTAGTPVDERRIVLLDAVRALVVAHRALVASYAATSLRFTLDGRLVGDIAEATAADAFGLELCRVRTPGVDALTAGGRTVQVKSSGIGKGPAFTPGEGRAHHLIFLLIDFENAVAHVRYNGLEAPVRAALPEVLGGTRRVQLAKVLALDAAVPDGHRLERVRYPRSGSGEQGDGRMEQATRARAHLERILLVCGMPNAGKSRLIRRMFADRRLGGDVPTHGPLRPRALSRERCLAGRLTSPHEAGETPAQFHQKIDDACAAAWSEFWRLCYVSAVQPHPRNLMPGIVDVCAGLRAEFLPERIRVVQLAPDQWGNAASRLTDAEVDGLRLLDVEVLAIDARRSAHLAEPGNERILADFFDFS